MFVHRFPCVKMFAFLNFDVFLLVAGHGLPEAEARKVMLRTVLNCHTHSCTR